MPPADDRKYLAGYVRVFNSFMRQRARACVRACVCVCVCECVCVVVCV